MDSPSTDPFRIAHENYAKQLIFDKVGRASTISVEDCFSLMMEFSASQVQLTEQFRRIAEDAIHTQPRPVIIFRDGRKPPSY